MMAMHLLICLKMFMSPPNIDSEVVALVVGEGDAGTGIVRVVSMCCKRMRSWKEGGYGSQTVRSGAAIFKNAIHVT